MKNVITTVIIITVFVGFIASPVLINKIYYNASKKVHDTNAFEYENKQLDALKSQIDSFISTNMLNEVNDSGSSIYAETKPLSRTDYAVLYGNDGKLKPEISAYLETLSNSSSLTMDELVMLVRTGQLKKKSEDQAATENSLQQTGLQQPQQQVINDQPSTQEPVQQETQQQTIDTNGNSLDSNGGSESGGVIDLNNL